MKNQFVTIKPWIPHVLGVIKKDIKTDHLPGSPIFVRTHFGSRPLNRLTTEEIFNAYEKDLLNGDEELSEWVVNHWVFQHGEIYDHFSDGLSQITEDYNEIENLTEAQSEEILKDAPEKFGALSTYLFAVLNGVVFPEKVFEKLRAAAEKEDTSRKEEEKKAHDFQTLEQAKERHARDVAKLQEKYENKISGVMKKYTTEVEALKKQIRSLQKQLVAK